MAHFTNFSEWVRLYEVRRRKVVVPKWHPKVEEFLDSLNPQARDYADTF